MGSHNGRSDYVSTILRLIKKGASSGRTGVMGTGLGESSSRGGHRANKEKPPLELVIRWEWSSDKVSVRLAGSIPDGVQSFLAQLRAKVRVSCFRLEG